VSHNDDLSRLVEKGYALGFDSNYLVVRDIPYLDEKCELWIGAIISKMVIEDSVHVRLHNHEIFFCGSHPYQSDGNRIPNLGGGETTLVLEAQDLIVQRSFSNKPPHDYVDFFDKIDSYVAMISGPAIQLHNANPWTFRINETVTGSVFKVHDTMTSLAEIGDLNQNFKEDVIAIIGLGGTGSYLLDLLAKTPVKEIRGFDKDFYYAHNAFRSPGKLENEELGKPKAEIYQNRYDGFRHNVKIEHKYIYADSVDDLVDVTFAFVSVDKGSARKEIFELLIKLKIPFIDVGMGLDRKTGPIGGGLRTVYYSAEQAEELYQKGLSPVTDDKGDIYNKNIQIAELNALNACLAVIKFKQIRGFYFDEIKAFHLLYGIENSQLAKE